ncbi:uncharacterized protein BCR38DRAFT_414705 [Pseudomassariella vexata]|uniref:Uncharacterized protein n=1 Tax=Pseudomassariella vexata TaxID=1141098 RepID=A0A1Y2D9N9_9PEZI|nr:uncharacterized protein BCR38DRAFT_414705 [Pseudomassariella vexata]ORY55846.1 hypothetical protein BCR38DRAFT_414705 [Pseudomassariella vexata]
MQSSPSTQQLDTKTVNPKSRGYDIHPDTSSPTETAQRIRIIVNRHLTDLDKVAAELAPSFGLGSDLLAQQRAQFLFAYPGLHRAFDEFDNRYIAGGYDLPLPEWHLVLPLVHKHVDNPKWARLVYPDYRRWDVNSHYARFIERVMSEIHDRTEKKRCNLVFWVRTAGRDDAYWVLFHALMYLHLARMLDNQRNSPLKERIKRLLSH